MDPVAGAALAGQAAQAYLRRSRVTVSVDEDYDTFGDMRVKRFFFPVGTPDELTELRDLGSRTSYSKPFDWINENRGIELGHTVFEFEVQALNATVALTGGKPVLRPGFGSVDGIAILPPPAGGPLEGNYLLVSLDDETLVCHRGDDPSAPRVPFRFEIPQGSTEVFRVHAYTTSRPTMWFLRLRFIVNGKTVRYDLRRDNGEDFVTLPFDYSGIRDSYTWEQGRWELVPNR